MIAIDATVPTVHCTKVNVLAGAPEISYDDRLEDTIKLKAGNSIIITVNVSGSPTPQVSWYFGEETIVLGADTSIETTEESSTLTIKGATGKNSGIYRVVAENKAGSDSAEFTAQIRGR